MSKKPILWVEDDPDDQELIALALEDAGLQEAVRFVEDGPKALDRLSACAADELPAAIVLDYKMPLMEAPEILERLRGNPAWQAIPVVVFTSSGGAAAGCRQAEVLAKPVEAALFREAVQALARRWAAP